MNLYDKYLEKLIAVNDENVSEEKHKCLLDKFYGWLEGVYDATGQTFNGDYYYIDKIESGEMEDRPMCAGVFLDWESNYEKKTN